MVDDRGRNDSSLITSLTGLRVSSHSFVLLYLLDRRTLKLENGQVLSAGFFDGGYKYRYAFFL